MTTAKMKIKKGDTVIVRTGKDKGKKGEVLQTLPAKSRVIVQGVNVVKKHQKPTQFAAGGIVEKEAALAISNVAIFNAGTQKADRLGYKIEDGKKVLIYKYNGEQVGA